MGELTAKLMSQELASDLEQRIRGSRSLKVEWSYGEPIRVELKGFWNNTFIRGALNQIGKAYRLSKAKHLQGTIVVCGGKIDLVKEEEK